MATKLQTLARWYADRMTTDKRADGETFYKFRDELSPGEVERCRALALDAHESARMLPDDWRYEFISQALDALAENEDPDDIQLEADVYTSELTRWLGSRADRAAYCDEAAREYGSSADTDMFTRLQLGQLAEKNEVLASVRGYLENEADADEARAEADGDGDDGAA